MHFPLSGDFCGMRAKVRGQGGSSAPEPASMRSDAPSDGGLADLGAKVGRHPVTVVGVPAARMDVPVRVIAAAAGGRTFI